MVARLALLLSLALAMPCYAGLLVSSFATDSVLEYDLTTGGFLGAFVSVAGPTGHTFGPDGNFYVSSGTGNAVLKYSPTGTYLGTAASGGGLQFPAGVAFGPDGDLYVVSEGTGAIIRYDPISGTAVGTFAVVPGSGNRVPIHLMFGPSFDLYVSTQLPNSEILRFNGATGALIGTFASGGGLFFPTQFAFGPDGSLYVNSLGTDSVLQYSGSTGAFLGVFAQGQGLNETSGDNGGLAFGPGGDLFVSNALADNIVRFNGASGVYDGVLVPSGAGGLDNPTWLTVRPVPEPATLSLLVAGLLLLVGFRSTSNFGLQRRRYSGVAAVASR